MSFSVAIAGFGAMGRLHHAKWAELGVGTVAVVDPEAAAARGERERGDGRPGAGGRTPGAVPFVPSVRAAAWARPALWSVCVPTDRHVTVLDGILRETGRYGPRTRVLVEKPVCGPRDVPAMRALLRAYRPRLVVNENYYSSRVVEEVATSVRALRLVPRRVVVEMSKHRGRDVRAGRFQDRMLGALGYEGPHLVAVAHALGRALGRELLPRGAAEVRFEGPWHVAGRLPQDGVRVRYTTPAGCEVVLHSSLSGRIGHPVTVTATGAERALIPYGSPVRHRLLSVVGEDPYRRAWTVTGLFEPVDGMPRGHGLLLVRDERGPAGAARVVRDDSLGRHLARALGYFRTGTGNPAPVEVALAHVELLHAWARAARAPRTGVPAPARTDPPARARGKRDGA